jgi:hypothetical protein
MKHCLVQDGDGHWYVIPVDRQADFVKWAANTDETWVPDWASAVNGSPTLVTFNKYQIG